MSTRQTNRVLIHDFDFKMVEVKNKEYLSVLDGNNYTTRDIDMTCEHADIIYT